MKHLGTVAIVLAVGILGGLIGWFANDWMQPEPRLPEVHVVGTIGKFEASGTCVKPDSANEGDVCASTIATGPTSFSVGTRVRGAYSVFPSEDRGPLIWVSLERLP